MKWYRKILGFILFVIFFPIIFAVYIIYLFDSFKERKIYKNSIYYKDIKTKYKKDIIYSPKYLFYTSNKNNVNYIKQKSNGLEYFIYENVLYLFPDFDQIEYDEKENLFKVSYDGVWDNFQTILKNTIKKIDDYDEYSCIKMLIARYMITNLDISNIDIPNNILLTLGYEYKFEKENHNYMYKIPENVEELYNMMKQNKEICGEYYIEENNIIWNLFEDIRIYINLCSPDCYIGFNLIKDDQLGKEITHSHPGINYLYNEICNISKKDNIVIIHTTLFSTKLIYIGDKDKCPNKFKRKKYMIKELL